MTPGALGGCHTCHTLRPAVQCPLIFQQLCCLNCWCDTICLIGQHVLFNLSDMAFPWALSFVHYVARQTLERALLSLNCIASYNQMSNPQPTVNTNSVPAQEAARSHRATTVGPMASHPNPSISPFQLPLMSAPHPTAPTYLIQGQPLSLHFLGFQQVSPHWCQGWRLPTFHLLPGLRCQEQTLYG
jgi:hypothetical protein